jgi:heat shock protein HslJ
MKNLIFVFALITSFFTTGCDETKKVIDVAGSVQLSGTYTVTQVQQNSKGTNVAQTLTLSALDKSIRGTTGCNSFFGSYQNDLYAITFTDIAATEKACSPTIMAAEQAFLNAIENTGSYNLENNELTFFSKADRTVLLKATKNTN